MKLILLVKIVGAGRIVKKLAEDFGIIMRDFSINPVFQKIVLE